MLNHSLRMQNTQKLVEWAPPMVTRLIMIFALEIKIERNFLLEIL